MDGKNPLAAHFQSRNYATSAWSELWDRQQSYWDRGQPSPALVDLLESGDAVVKAGSVAPGRRPRALVPGCGRGYDVVCLALHGFDAYGLEVSATGADEARRYAAAEMQAPHAYNGGVGGPPGLDGAGTVTIWTGDFFDGAWATEPFDLIYDYTFLCALHPRQRRAWADRMHALLAPTGVLFCLEFPLQKDRTLPGPPWGLRDVHWDLLAEGGDGRLDDQDRADPDTAKRFERIRYFRPARTHQVGRDSDMVSVWKKGAGGRGDEEFSEPS